MNIYLILCTWEGDKFPRFTFFRGETYKDVIRYLHTGNVKFNGYIRLMKNG